MGALKHFTILELHNEECPMIGTIDNVIDSKVGLESFKERFEKAIKTAFDIDTFTYEAIPDLFIGSSHEDMWITIEDVEHEIRILETWIY